MPNWNQVLSELTALKAQTQASQSQLASPVDQIRRHYLALLSKHTGRNVIAYYSGWIVRSPNTPELSIDDNDKNAFMATIHGLDRSLGLDLILHTPGGSLAAAESIVDYLRRMFGTNIRAIVPQLAMSAGTMIACSCKEIVMGKQSNLGPIDPQFGGVPAYGVLAEFKKAVDEVKSNPASIPMWQTIIGKYHPTFIGQCEHAIEWSKEVVEKWLVTGMFAGKRAAISKARKVVKALSSPDLVRSHSRHIHIEYCQNLGLNIIELESDPVLQDLVLTTHHTFMQTFTEAPMAVKIIENQKGVAMVRFAGVPGHP
ncbi:MAG: hypothetical protein Q7T21_10935 [Gallionella sp.]|nr:hypothetical protein [Gallionella sp.]